MPLVTTTSEHRFQCIKGAELSDGILSGAGFALAGYQSLDGHEIVYHMPTADLDTIIFLFGLRGIGNHYRIDIDSSRNRIVLNRVRDGISTYLHHAYLDLKKEPSLSIRWCRSSIRLFSGTVCFMNVLADDLVEGRWGFAGRRQSMRLPEVTVEVHSSPHYAWIVLGDGYSNNRWSNRNFYSWPELAFGDKLPYLNACVAAGNTRRVLEIAHQIGADFADSKVILAVGADDFMEGESLEDTIARLRQITNLARGYGATEVHICSLLPKPKYPEGLPEWNRAIAGLAGQEFNSLIDFHHWLDSSPNELLVHGDYPGAEAQGVLATGVLHCCELPNRLASLKFQIPQPLLKGIAARAGARIGSWIDHSLGRF